MVANISQSCSLPAYTAGGKLRGLHCARRLGVPAVGGQDSAGNEDKTALTH